MNKKPYGCDLQDSPLASKVDFSYGKDNENEYLPSDEYRTFVVSGELAARIRIAAGVGSDVEVRITESITYGGTDVTQEQYAEISVAAGDFSKEIEGGWGSDDTISVFSSLLRWLDEVAPV